MAAVEFAILGTAFIMILGGIIDFGHAWYLKQLVTNASREGARYGVAYQVDSTATRTKPQNFSPTIEVYTNGLLSGLSTTVTPSGAGYTTGAKGQPVQVKVNAPKNWFFLGSFLPSGTLPTTLSTTTTMLCE